MFFNRKYTVLNTFAKLFGFLGGAIKSTELGSIFDFSLNYVWRHDFIFMEISLSLNWCIADIYDQQNNIRFVRTRGKQLKKLAPDIELNPSPSLIINII